MSLLPLAVSIAAPAYNEGEGLAELLGEWLVYLRAQEWIASFEIVICNDGSRDETGKILDRLAAESPELKPVHHTVNQGAAAALASAIRNSVKPWVLLTDADGQFPIENLRTLVAALERSGRRAGIGVRAVKHDGVFARWGSRASGGVCNLLHGTRYRDFNSAFKLIDGSVLRSMTLEAKGLNYSLEITSRLIERGIPVTEVEISHRPRQRGTSSMHPLRGSVHRLLFVLYLGLRQMLLRLQVLRRQAPCL